MAGHTLSKRHFLGPGRVRAVGVFAFLAADFDAALRWDRERSTRGVAGAGAVVTP